MSHQSLLKNYHLGVKVIGDHTVLKPLWRLQCQSVLGVKMSQGQSVLGVKVPSGSKCSWGSNFVEAITSVNNRYIGLLNLPLHPRRTQQYAFCTL